MKFIDMWNGSDDDVLLYHSDSIYKQPTLNSCVECDTLTFFYSSMADDRLCSTTCHDQYMDGLSSEEAA